MNPAWKDFLTSQQAQVAENGDICFTNPASDGQPGICPLPHLGILTVAGADAAKLLQGQCTCDIKTVSETRSSFGAICNPKGRTIATFLIVKQQNSFLVLLPVMQAETVQKTLQRYVLRSAVTISDSSEAFALLGISGSVATAADIQWPQEAYAVTQTSCATLLRYPVAAPRYLLLAPVATAQEQWLALRQNGFRPVNTAWWRQQDIEAGIPWLDFMNSEQFIPQMLNLDALGGIGFNKGCYTGQEVVARTQYLGTVKRRLYYAECSPLADIAADMNIVDHDAGEDVFVAGKLLTAQRDAQKLHLLIVMQTSSAASKNLRLDNVTQDRITIKPLVYCSDTLPT